MAKRYTDKPESKIHAPVAEELARMVDCKIAELQVKNPRLDTTMFKMLISDVLKAISAEAVKAGDPKEYFKDITSDHAGFQKQTDRMLFDAMLNRLLKS